MNAVKAWFSCSGSELLTMGEETLAGNLAAVQISRRLSGEPAQISSWRREAEVLADLVRELGGQRWMFAFEFDLLRLEKRIDVVLLIDRAILVLEFKVGPTKITTVDRAQAEDYALDLWDFHAGSGAHPIVPVVVAPECIQPASYPSTVLPAGVAPVGEANALTLSALVRAVLAACTETLPIIDSRAWLNARYQPVPTIIEAAATLFARNSVADIAEARADAPNLNQTTDAIYNALAKARKAGQRVVIFVTGIPGAGKTLCGLNVVFGAARHDGSAFLTGNSPLVAVLREALACNAVGIDLDLGPSNDPNRRRRSAQLREARHVTTGKLQNVHNFLRDNAGRLDPPAERVIVFDEAQRAWDAAQATRDTQRRVSTLSMSEPAHTLEIMGRHDGFSAIVALIGGGQEINTGEAGLAEWGRVIAAAQNWKAIAAPAVLLAEDRTQRLANEKPDWLSLDEHLDLKVPMRSVRDDIAAAWVDAVLRNANAEAKSLAAKTTLPFLLTRSLDTARAALRKLAAGRRRAGFVRSSGARRLRAEGFDAQLIGNDQVADWFLERWPDIRASDALEVAATEYSCQGLELDLVGMAWGGDFVRQAGAWMPRRFSGRDWQAVNAEEECRYIRNTYRVLLTRARYETIIWVPAGSSMESFYDKTRPAVEMNSIAAFLLDCGARMLEEPLPAAKSES